MVRSVCLSFFLPLLLSLSIGKTQAETLEGQWTGSWAADETASIDILRDDDGFTLRLDLPELKLLSTKFVPASKPNVFEPERDTGLFGFFGDGDTGPLHESPVIWARQNNDQLIFYRLVIDKNGGMTLDRLMVADETAHLAVRLEQIVNGISRPPIDAQLEGK